jgi:hypothetical protein
MHIDDKNDKIFGMITFHRTTNFGSCLQTYGLYKKISDLGYFCEVIDYRCPAIELRENLAPKSMSFSPRGIARRLLLQPALSKKSRSLERFITKNINLGPIYTPETIINADQRYEKVFAGSDIVWGRDVTGNDYTYFLDFIKENKKKYAFASSVGNCIIHDSETKLKKLLSEFSKIAVREDEAVLWVKNISNRDASLVCDPTMLLNLSEWNTIIKPKKQSQNYVLVYFDNDNHKCINDAIEYAKLNGKRVVCINYGLPLRGIKNVKPVSLEEFLGWIYYSDFVFTASYHGMLFSIYYQKEFLFYTRAHKSRVLSLARRLQLANYCGDNCNINDYRKIDYQKVSQAVLKFRNESIQILQEMLAE